LTGEATLEWVAVDPDDDADDLKITLEYKPAADEDWQAMASDQPNTGNYIWDKYLQAGARRPSIGSESQQLTWKVRPERPLSEEFTVIALTRTVVAAPNPTSNSGNVLLRHCSKRTLYVYDIAGRLVHTAELSAAAHAHEWNLHSSGKPVANGVYLYVVMAGEERSEVGRLVVSR